MSETVTISGVLTPVELTGAELEEYAEKECISNGLEVFRDECDSWCEVLSIEHEDYYYNNATKTLYKLDSYESDGNFVRVSQNPDGSLSFITQFYNGGTYLGEMLDEGLEDLKDN